MSIKAGAVPDEWEEPGFASRFIEHSLLAGQEYREDHQSTMKSLTPVVV
jgi:hypothetical protein